MTREQCFELFGIVARQLIEQQMHAKPSTAVEPGPENGKQV